MTQFLCAAWKTDDVLAACLAQSVDPVAAAAGWVVRLNEPNLRIWCGGPCPPEVRRHDDGLITVGDVFEKPMAGGVGPSRTGLEACRALADRSWGRYVALVPNGDRQPRYVFRDPSGAVDCLVWMQGPVTYVASDTPGWLIDHLKPDWRLDWDQVAGILVDPTLVSADTALEGVQSVAPGHVLRLEAGAESTEAVWSPASCARSLCEDVPSARKALRDAVDKSIHHQLARSRSVLIEISGGLDSAIVASAARAADITAQLTGINYFGPDPEGDERSYAQLVAGALDIPLETRHRRQNPKLADAWLTHPRHVRPALIRIDSDYDEAQAMAATSLGADTILTGKGGDAALFQMGATSIFADVVRSRGLSALCDPASLRLARWLRRSVWTVIRHGFASDRRKTDAYGVPPAVNLMASGLRGVERRRRHPWLADIADLAPAKQMQITALAGNLSQHGPSRQSGVADVVHPLLSQPVLEICLAIPSIVLTAGSRDRALARSAFGDRLPDGVRDRRSKGELAAYFGRSISARLPKLREHLLDGLLVRRGLLDLDRTEAALHSEHLIWQGGYGEIMIAAIIESWVRSWDDYAAHR